MLTSLKYQNNQSAFTGFSSDDEMSISLFEAHDALTTLEKKEKVERSKRRGKAFCFVCHKEFSDSRYLHQHLEKDGHFHCRYCLVIFRTENDHKIH